MIITFGSWDILQPIKYRNCAKGGGGWASILLTIFVCPHNQGTISMNVTAAQLFPFHFVPLRTASFNIKKQQLLSSQITKTTCRVKRSKHKCRLFLLLIIIIIFYSYFIPDINNSLRNVF
eukprot:TRINITY_DN244_c10_g1_i1.p1 TRINITY_DN244_c10_g1~~TRINITY_DN244_c10_g1_i1.p1  ORF type:complete len:120 (-),score=11.45 TRINITY_DN244_c10_g1_i1:334-693(-)